jgi:hypothetical protein
LVEGVYVLHNYQHTDLVHEAVWGRVVVTAGVSEMQGGSCLVADHLVYVAAVAAACLQLLVHELCNRWGKTLRDLLLKIKMLKFHSA